jgi:hypothetical protein
MGFPSRLRSMHIVKRTIRAAAGKKNANGSGKGQISQLLAAFALEPEGSHNSLRDRWSHLVCRSDCARRRLAVGDLHPFLAAEAGKSTRPRTARSRCLARAFMLYFLITTIRNLGGCRSW